MSIREYIEILWRRKWVIVICTVAGLLLAVAATLLTTPKYRASTTLRVLPVSGGSSADWVRYDTGQHDRLMNTYAEFAVSRPMLTDLIERLELEEQPRIQVEPLIGTELMQISVEATSPVAAMESANTLAQMLVDESRELYTGSGKSAQDILSEQLAQVRAELDQAWVEYENLIADSPEDAQLIAAASRTIELKEETYAALLDQYERLRVREAVLANTLSIIEPAIAPRSPSKPRMMMNIALGGIVGLVGGIALAFLLENLDTRLYADEQIERITQLPILGKIPYAGRLDDGALFNGNSPQGEAFRRLRTNVYTLDYQAPLKTMMVTSAGPREGKTTVVANLARTLAQSGRKVIAVDAHLRLPSLHNVYHVSNRVGLSSVLQRKTDLNEAIQSTEIPGAHVLTSGPLPEDPAELLSSPHMIALLEHLAHKFDMVLVDTPSLLAVTDALAFARTMDGVVLVVERAHTQQPSVVAARQQLADVQANPLGVVVNRTEQDASYGYYQRMPT